MNTDREVFENHPNPSTARQESPFSIAQDAAATPATASPFTPVARQESPFMIADDAKPTDPEKAVKLPDRRKMESPFQIAEPSEGFGFEAPAKAFETPPVKSPFAPTTPAAPPSPFAVQGASVASTQTQAAIAAFTNLQDPADFAAPDVPPQPAKEPAAANEDFYSDSFSIRQLELRAIFGADREMNAEEIIQRSRTLPGIRNIARLNPQDMSTIEALKNLISSLGFGSGHLKLYSDSVPLEFIREGPVMLAVQTDGGFAPGIRETLIIVARELNRLD